MIAFHQTSARMNVNRLCTEAILEIEAAAVGGRMSLRTPLSVNL